MIEFNHSQNFPIVLSSLSMHFPLFGCFLVLLCLLIIADSLIIRACKARRQIFCTLLATLHDSFFSYMICCCCFLLPGFSTVLAWRTRTIDRRLFTMDKRFTNSNNASALPLPFLNILWLNVLLHFDMIWFSFITFYAYAFLLYFE